MLHIVKEPFRPVPDHVLRAMFAARKSVFVDLLKWQVPVLDGRFENHAREHASMPLATNGLDIRTDHPAADATSQKIHRARVSRLGAAICSTLSLYCHTAAVQVEIATKWRL